VGKYFQILLENGVFQQNKPEAVMVRKGGKETFLQVLGDREVFRKLTFKSNISSMFTLTMCLTFDYADHLLRT